MLASFFGRADIVELLLNRDPRNINSSDDFGWTALLDAVRQNHFNIVELLLANGADIFIANDLDSTPLMEAVVNERVEITSLLLDQISKILSETSNPDIHATVHQDVQNALRIINLRRPMSIDILQAFHIFARKHTNKFPELEVNINLLMGKAAAPQDQSVYQKVVEYLRSFR